MDAVQRPGSEVVAKALEWPTRHSVPFSPGCTSRSPHALRRRAYRSRFPPPRRARTTPSWPRSAALVGRAADHRRLGPPRDTLAWWATTGVLGEHKEQTHVSSSTARPAHPLILSGLAPARRGARPGAHVTMHGAGAARRGSPRGQGRGLALLRGESLGLVALSGWYPRYHYGWILRAVETARTSYPSAAADCTTSARPGEARPRLAAARAAGRDAGDAQGWSPRRGKSRPRGRSLSTRRSRSAFRRSATSGAASARACWRTARAAIPRTRSSCTTS
jgi:hypothetical protein